MGVQSAIVELFPAIYGKLAPAGVTNSVLAGLGVTGVFDIRAVPDGQPYNYITIGDVIERSENTFGRRGYICAVTLHIWSRADGVKNSALILARLNELLDQQDLILSSHEHVSTEYDQAMIIPDPDGLSLHTAVRYRIYTEE